MLLYIGYREVPEIQLQNVTGFSQVSEESSGQLYAYRVNSSAVYLGTRNAQEFGAAIGIGIVANGTYNCNAQNLNEVNSKEITVIVQSKF